MAGSFTFSPSFAALIVHLRENPDTVSALFDALYADRWTGQVLLNFRHGRPLTADFPRIERVPLKPPSA